MRHAIQQAVTNRPQVENVTKLHLDNRDGTSKGYRTIRIKIFYNLVCDYPD